jgi:hypothetical protein
MDFVSSRKETVAFEGKLLSEVLPRTASKYNKQICLDIISLSRPYGSTDHVIFMLSLEDYKYINLCVAHKTK